MYIALENITYGYDYEKPLLKDLSLSIDKGQSVALMGANGCGKTTVLKILSGILPLVKGKYVFDGTEITPQVLKNKKTSRLFHQRIGYVFQNSENQLFCPTVEEEIRFGLEQMGLSDEVIEGRVADVLALLHIEGLRHSVPYHCSGGQQKRIAIAAVLAMNPDVIIMDEPMAALDPRTQVLLLDILQQLHEEGKTLLIATHDIHMVHEMVERIVLFGEDHSLVVDGKAVDIVQQAGLLKKVNLVDPHYHVHVHHHQGDEELHLHN